MDFLLKVRGFKVFIFMLYVLIGTDLVNLKSSLQLRHVGNLNQTKPMLLLLYPVHLKLLSLLFLWIHDALVSFFNSFNPSFHENIFQHPLDILWRAFRTYFWRENCPVLQLSSGLKSWKSWSIKRSFSDIIFSSQQKVVNYKKSAFEYYSQNSW